MVFRAAFDAVLQDAADAALAALDVEGTVAERLDGYLQRANGDAYDAMAATPFGTELSDKPTTEVYRRRLSALANAAAALVHES